MSGYHLQRCAIVLVLPLCLLPLAWSFTDFDLTDLWSKLDEKLAGKYELPSGLLYEVRVRNGQLLAGEPPYSLSRASRTLYVNASRGVKLDFEIDERGRIPGVTIYGLGPKMRASRVPRATPQPAQLVSVGKHKIRLLKAGSAGPAVVLEGGPLGSLEGFSKLQGELAESVMTIAYDHAGTGGSEISPDPRDARQVARELFAALRSAGVEPPYILVGVSMGGPYVRVFAQEFPDAVGGLVLIDPTPDRDELFQWCERHSPKELEDFRRAFRWGELGVESHLAKRESGRIAEWAARGHTWKQAREARVPPGIAAVQITGARGQESRPQVAAKVKFFSWWLDKYMPQARHILAHESRHGVYGTEPKLVLTAILDVVEACKNQSH